MIRRWSPVQDVEIDEIPTVPDTEMNNTKNSEKCDKNDNTQPDEEEEELIEHTEDPIFEKVDRKGWRRLPRCCLFHILSDLRKSFLGDMLYGMHRDVLLGLLIFGFVVAFLLLWIVVVDIFGANGSLEYSISFGTDPPSLAIQGYPMKQFTVNVLDKNLGKVPGAEVSIFMYPATSFDLNISVGVSLEPVYIRTVDCTSFLYDDPTIYSIEDNILCIPQLRENVVVTDSNGVAIFDSFSVMSGVAVPHTMIISTKMPAHLMDPTDNLVPGNHLEHQLTIQSPIRSASVLSTNSTSVEAEITFRRYNYSVALNLTHNIVSGALCGRHSDLPEFGPFSDLSSQRTAEYYPGGLELIHGSLDVTAVHITGISLLWSTSNEVFPILLYGGRFLLIGEVVSNFGSSPSLNKPFLTSSNPKVQYNVSGPLLYDIEIQEGTAIPEFTVQISPPAVGTRIAVLVKYFNGNLLPSYWLPAGGSDRDIAEDTGFKNVINPVSSLADSSSSVVFNILFSESGAVGVYGIVFSLFGVQSEVYNITVTSAVAGVTPKFASSYPGSTDIFVGEKWVNNPSFFVYDSSFNPLKGKRVTISIVEAPDAAVTYSGHESDPRGLITLTDLRITYAVAEANYSLLFMVDDVEAFFLEVFVQFPRQFTSPLLCAHVRVLQVSIPNNSAAVQFGPSGGSVAVYATPVNFFGKRLPNINVWGHVGSGSGAYPPVVLNNQVGNRESEKVASNLTGIAVLKISFNSGEDSLVDIHVSCLGIASVITGERDLFFATRIPVVNPPLDPTPVSVAVSSSEPGVYNYVPVGPSDLTFKILQSPRRLQYVLSKSYLLNNETSSMRLSSSDGPGTYIAALYRNNIWTGFVKSIVIPGIVWALYMKQESRTISEISSLLNIRVASVAEIGVPFLLQPKISVLDSAGNGVSGVILTAGVLNPNLGIQSLYLYPPHTSITEGCLGTLSAVVGSPLSVASDISGEASFYNLGFVGGPRNTTIKIYYIYLTAGEGSDAFGSPLPSIFTSERVTRMLSDGTTPQITTQPGPVAGPGTALKFPVTVRMVNSVNQFIPASTTSPTVLIVQVHPFNVSNEISGSLVTQQTGLRTSYAALVMAGLVFSKSSDFGNYKLRILAPGGSTETTGISLTGDPQLLQILSGGSPGMLVVGSPKTVVVVAKLADGSTLPGVLVTAELIRKSTESCYGDGCGILSQTSAHAITEVSGQAIFHIIINTAMTGEYSIKFTSKRGVNAIFGIATSLGKASQLYGGARIPSGNIASTPTSLQGYLQNRVSSTTGGSSIASAILSKAFSSAMVAATTISIQTKRFTVFNEVSVVKIITQPILDPISDSVVDPIKVLEGRYGLFDIQPVVQVFDSMGTPLEDRDISVSVVPAGSTVFAHWNKTVRTDANGSYEFVSLLFNNTLPGIYKIVFSCEGQPSNESISVLLLPQQNILNFGSIYWRALLIVMLLLPWLLSNVPDSSKYWTYLGLLLSIGFPYVAYQLLPGAFLSTQLFIRLTGYLCAVLWAGITLLLMKLLVAQIAGWDADAISQLGLQYRYVRWLSKHIPFVGDEEILIKDRESYIWTLLTKGQKFKKIYFDAIVRHIYSISDTMPLTGRPGEPIWFVHGPITLHRNPCCYYTPVDTFKWKYGVLPHVSFTKQNTKIGISLRGCCMKDFEGEVLKKELRTQTGLQIKEMYISKDATSVAAVVVHITVEGSVSDDAKADPILSAINTNLIGKSITLQKGSCIAEKIIYIDKGQVRRDNDSEWTIQDTFTINAYYSKCPVIVEKESWHMSCYDSLSINDLVDDVSEAETNLADENEKQESRKGVIWIRHSPPQSVVRSNGDSFPEFWTPSYDANHNLILREHVQSSIGTHQVPLDSLTPEHGGRPKDIPEPLSPPFRFLVSSCICLIVIAVLIFSSYWLYTVMVTWLTNIQNRIPEPPDVTPAEKQKINDDLRISLKTALESVANADPRFTFIYAFIPTIEDIDFIELWEFMYDLSTEIIKSARIAGYVATASGALAMAANWLLLNNNIPKVMKSIRRNRPIEPLVRSKAQCVIADRYVGLQAMHLVLAYFIIFSLVFLIMLIVLTPSITTAVKRALETVAITAVLTSLATVIMELFVKLTWATGDRVRHPLPYSRWQLLAIVLHTVSGMVTTIVRWIKSIMAQTVVFARLDLDLFPAGLKFLDTGYWSYHSMVYVHETHNNPILRVFLSITMTDVFVSDVEPASTPEVHKIRIRMLCSRSDSLDPHITKLIVYTDREPTALDGSVLVQTDRTSNHDLRFFRSPLPTMTASKSGCGCCICGQSELARFYSPPAEEVGYLYYRLISLNSNCEDATKPLVAVDTQFQLQTTDGITRLGSTREQNGVRYICSLDKSSRVKSFKIMKPSRDPKEESTEDLTVQYLLLASHDTFLWCVYHDTEKDDEDTTDSETICGDPHGLLCICYHCYGSRAVSENDPRSLIEVPLIQTTESPHCLEYRLLSPVKHIRGYAIITSSDEPDCDPISWAVEIRGKNITPVKKEKVRARQPNLWILIHEVIKTRCIPLHRKAPTVIFPCWSRGSVRSLESLEGAVANIKRKTILLPALRDMMLIRIRHMYGIEGRLLSKHNPHPDESDDSKVSPEPLFISSRERDAYRRIKCHKGKWAMAFLLIMNPSLLQHRKNRRMTTASISGRGTSSTRMIQIGPPPVRSTNIELQANTAILRNRLTSVWRQGELTSSDQSQRRKSRIQSRISLMTQVKLAATNTLSSTLRNIPLVFSPRSKTLNKTLSCSSSQLYSTTYRYSEQLQSVRIDVANRKSYADSFWFLDLISENVISARLDQQNVTEQFKKLLEIKQPREALNLSVFMTNNNSKEELFISYTTPVWLSTCMISHRTPASHPYPTVSFTSTISRVNGCWLVGPKIPLAGPAYSLIMSKPTPVMNISDSVISWSVWDCEQEQWIDTVTVTFE